MQISDILMEASPFGVPSFWSKSCQDGGNLKSNRILLIGGNGYVGSFLFERLIFEGFSVAVCDLMIRGNPLQLPIGRIDYNSLSSEFLERFDVVLWFAGHSSVGQSLQDPQGAIANNCLNLFSFAKRLSSGTKLIYASTASLYSSSDRSDPVAENGLISIPAHNSYDISKFAFDYLAEHFLCGFFGLRMGTVSGFSPNLRSELIFNAMNISAFRDGVVRVKNADRYRSILFLGDLWDIICKLILTDIPSGFYNAGSYTATIGDLGRQIAQVWGARLIDEGISPTYSFKLDTSKIQSFCGIEFSSRSFSSECESLINSIHQR
ncbi:MAG: SDR family oxidoreductase [Roseomonas sp.]|nr:SDR family oxidoreductase [Roseomonas sp.]